MHSNSKIYFFQNLHLTIGDLDIPISDFKLIEITLNIPKILRYHMIFTCRLTFQPVAAPATAPTPHSHWSALFILSLSHRCHTWRNVWATGFREVPPNMAWIFRPYSGVGWPVWPKPVRIFRTCFKYSDHIRSYFWIFEALKKGRKI